MRVEMLRELERYYGGVQAFMGRRIDSDPIDVGKRAVVHAWETHPGATLEDVEAALGLFCSGWNGEHVELTIHVRSRLH